TVPIAVFHAETGKFYALDDRCTHGAASLSEGFIETTLWNVHAMPGSSAFATARCFPCLPPWTLRPTQWSLMVEISCSTQACRLMTSPTPKRRGDMTREP